MRSEPDGATTESLPQAARRIAPRAGELAEQIERERALPPALVSELVAAGLFAMCLPRTLGGREAEPAEMVLAIEELARADGASAWCAMIASTSSLLGAYLPEPEATEIYAGGSGVCCGVFAPRGRAERREGGYVVSGRWPFMSGVGHSGWMLGGCVVYDGDQPELLENGGPDVRLVLMPTARVEVIDTWSVSGLRGTGSHDVSVSDELIPAARTASVLSDAPGIPARSTAFRCSACCRSGSPPSRWESRAARSRIWSRSPAPRRPRAARKRSRSARCSSRSSRTPRRACAQRAR